MKQSGGERRGWTVICLAALAIGVATVSGAGPALATVAGTNGPIVFLRSIRCTATGRYHERIFSVNPNGTNLQNLSGCGGGYSDYGPKVSPNGQKVAFTRCCINGVTQVYTMNINGSGQTDIGNDLYDESGSLAWSPTGTQIAFFQVGELAVMNSNGSSTTLVPNTPSGGPLSYTGLVWSPSGTALGFIADDSVTDDYELYTISPTGQNLTDLTYGTNTGGVFDWSPDGQTILVSEYNAGCNNYTTLWAVAANGSGGNSLDCGWTGGVDTASYSPDGTQIVLDDSVNMYTMPSYGSNAPTLLATGVDPSWGAQASSSGTPASIAAQFIVPSTMSTAASPTDPYSFAWKAGTCASGSTYTLTESVNGGSQTTAFTGTALSTKLGLLPGNLYTFAVSCGGSSVSTTFRLNGYQQTAATYGGTWSTTTFTGAWGGTAVYSSAKGASASFTCNCEALTWVTDEDTTHGSAQVYIDGKLVATVNTQSSAKKNRVVVFKAGWSTDGTHTIRIVNLATSGHPRVTVDGFLTRTSS